MHTTIYFSGSISGGRSDAPLYRQIVAALRAEGYEVLAGAVAEEDVGEGGESVPAEVIYERDLDWIDSSDMIVAEVTVPSLGVGYEIAYATRVRLIPVVALYRRSDPDQRCSAMVAGDPGVVLLEYDTPERLLPHLLESIRELRRYPDRSP